MAFGVVSIWLVSTARRHSPFNAAYMELCLFASGDERSFTVHAQTRDVELISHLFHIISRTELHSIQLHISPSSKLDPQAWSELDETFSHPDFAHLKRAEVSMENATLDAASSSQACMHHLAQLLLPRLAARNIVGRCEDSCARQG